jgi:glycosyltransferase involved in cell wall biosynthesis
MSKLLSIVIPSHNKTELLMAAIASILGESGFDTRCEICISDNSLSESTSEDFTEKYDGDERLIYRRSLDSSGLDENVARAVSMAKGEYVWVFGDDDLIVPGMIGSVLELLEKERYGLLVVNSQSFEDDKIVEQGRHFLLKDREYGPSENEDFLMDMGGYLTYVCSAIIKKDLWMSNFNSTLIGSFFAHLSTFLNAKKGNVAYFFSEPLIKMRLHCQTWTDHHFRIWNSNYPNVVWGLKGFSDFAKSRVVKRKPLHSVFSVLASRAYGRYDSSIFINYILPSTDCSLPFKFIHLCIALVPRTLFRLLYCSLIHLGIKKRSVNFSPDLALALLKQG